MDMFAFIWVNKSNRTVLPQDRTFYSLSKPSTGFVAASHHFSLSDVLNGYCLSFYTAPKVFNKQA